MRDDPIYTERRDENGTIHWQRRSKDGKLLESGSKSPDGSYEQWNVVPAGAFGRLPKEPA